MFGLASALIFSEKVCSYCSPLGLSYYIGKMVMAVEGGWLIFLIPCTSNILGYYDSSKTHFGDNQKNILGYVRNPSSPSQLSSGSHREDRPLNMKGYRQVHSGALRRFLSEEKQ